MSEKIAVIGLGYVGLPLLYQLQKTYHCIGFDVDEGKISKIKDGIDYTDEIGSQNAYEICELVTNNEFDLQDCTFFIITVPTPVDHYNIPNLSPLKTASKLVARYLKKNSLVVYESTVAPGTTEDICIPILESASGLVFNEEFGVG